MAPLSMARLMAQRSIRPATAAAAASFPPSTPRLRRLHQSSLLRLPRVDSQDKDSINTEATEYTKSGTDDDAARNEKAAFDPSQTAPEEEKAQAGEGNQQSGNPLEVSPANPDVSKQKPEQEGGAKNSASENSASERKQSGHGSPSKGKKI